MVSVIEPATRSNAGVANRQGDVDSCFSQVSPPVRTLV